MNTLRLLEKPVVALASPRPAGRPPRLAFLPIAALRIDGSFQRELTPRGRSNILHIANDFNWARFTPLMVARVPGKQEIYSIIDGQHRATAALLRGYELVPCAVVEAAAAEQAAIFAAVNGRVTPVTVLQLFKAARAAGEAWAKDVDAACAMAGLTALSYPKPRSTIRPFETMAIGTLRKLAGRFGVPQLGEALAQAARQPGADEPGFWGSASIEHAMSSHREAQGLKHVADAAAGTVPFAERVRELKGRGYSRFAIQAATGARLADIERVLGG